MSNSRKNAALLICKIAFKTTGHFGWAVILFMAVGIYLLFPAFQIYGQIRQEQSVPYVMHAAANGKVPVETIRQIEEIQSVTPVKSFSTQLTCKKGRIECPVHAVYAEYLQLQIIEGTLFPNQSNMPFLLINQYASQHFTDEKGEQPSVGVNDIVRFSVNGEEEKAKICGIFEDGLEEPHIYMSYLKASGMLPSEEGVDLLIQITHRGEAERAANQLAKLQVSTDFDENESLYWKLLNKQAQQSLLSALGFLICSLVLIKNKIEIQQKENKAEELRLLLSGMGKGYLKIIKKLRIIVLCCSCFLAAFLGAWICGSLTAISIPSTVTVLAIYGIIVTLIIK